MNKNSFNNLEEAVLCFYQSNNALQLEAQKWLTELQNSPQIWNIIWDDLLSSKLTELQFYGATLLHSKLLKDWVEIPINQYEPLKSKLLEAVVYFKDGPKIVLNRLCISLAMFILRTTPMFWPNAVSDLISLFQNVTNVPTETLTWLLLEILCVIPEEFSTTIFSKNEKIFVRSSLENDSLTVLSLLEAILPNSNIDVKLQTVRCAKSWLEFGLPPENTDNLLYILINTVLLTYKNAESSQCSINSIEAISMLCGHPKMEKYPKRVLLYLEKILSLTEILNSSQDITNNDLIPCLYTLFVNIGETHIKVLTRSLASDQRDIFLKLLYVILQCTNAPGSYPIDEIYSIQTFNFWYLLRDEIISFDTVKEAETIEIIKSLYKKLTCVLLEKSMYPENIMEWTRDDRDSFRCYRQDIADTYTYCQSVINDEFIDIILHDLEQLINNPNLAMEWRKIESHLHAFNAISENAIYSDNPKILNCILLLEKLPFSNMNIQVLQIMMELIGSYSEWLAIHPDLLGSVLSLVFTGAENAQLAAPATLALKDVTRECKLVLSPYAEQIAQKTTELLKQKHLKSSEEMRLIFSLGTVISLLPIEAIFKYLDDVVTPYVLRIQNVLTETQTNVKKAEQEIVDCVGVLTQLFLGLVVKPPYPVFCLLEKILPLFKDILIKYKTVKVISTICISIKCAVSNLNESCFDLLPIIVNIIVTTYPNNPNHSLLELAKQLLVLFGSTAMCMSDMLKELCICTLHTFENTSLENVSEHTYLFEHFYSFCTNVLRKNCKLLLNTEGVNLTSLFRYAGYALCAQETQTVKSVSSFLCNAITVSREQNPLLVVVQTHGAELVYHILVAIGKVSPLNCLELVAAVLVALSKKYCDWLTRWLNDILGQEGFPSHRASSDSKKRYIKIILREKANKRRVHDATKEFSRLCRGLISTDYVDNSSSAL